MVRAPFQLLLALLFIAYPRPTSAEGGVRPGVVKSCIVRGTMALEEALAQAKGDVVLGTTLYKQNAIEKVGLLKTKVIEGAKKYKDEMIATKGGRFFLKDAGLSKAELLAAAEGGLPKPRLIGKTWRISKRMVRRVAHTAVNPFDLPYRYLVEKPVGYVSQKVLGRALTPTIPVMMTIMGVGYYFLQQEINRIFTEMLVKDIERKIEAHADEFDGLIQSDYRFSDLKDQVSSGKITAAEARKMAYAINVAYQEYYKFMNEIYAGKNRNEAEEALLRHVLFENLGPVIRNGVQPAEGFDVPADAVGPIRKEQKHLLFDIDHTLYLKYQLIPLVVSGGDPLAKIQAGSDVDDLIAEIHDDPFSQALFELRDRKVLTDQELAWRLMEDADWKARFDRWEAIKVTRLQKDGDSYTSTPLSIETIRRETIDEIRKQSKK